VFEDGGGGVGVSTEWGLTFTALLGRYARAQAKQQDAEPVT
jgi:hypothetical protein